MIASVPTTHIFLMSRTCMTPIATSPRRSPSRSQLSPRASPRRASRSKSPKAATKSAASLHKTRGSAISKKSRVTTRNTQFLSVRRYSNKSVKSALSASTLKAIKDTYGYERLSKVQSATLKALMAGDDCFVKSKTGSGKTMAFLVPAIEMAAKARNIAICCLVVSPTKELAMQTYTEAQKLLKFHTGLRAELVIGGHPVSTDKRNLEKPGTIAVLVGTPGRLVDHIDNTPAFKSSMKGVKMIVLDEADNMLDMGFKKPLDAIFGATDGATRQTVLVSATMPADVMALADKRMKAGHKVIDVTGNAADAPRVNPQVKHAMRVCPNDMYAHALAREVRPGAIVFFPTNVQTELMAEMFARAFKDYKVLQIHGGLNQSKRERAAEDFRQNPKAILFTSDVSARGVDYPGVTLVVQMGVTTEEHYTHRLGRGGRAGHAGEGVIVVLPFEAPGMKKTLAKLGVAVSDYTDLKHDPNIDKITAQVDGDAKLRKLAEKAYRSWVGAYASRAAQLGVKKPDIVKEADSLFAGLGLKKPPVISDATKKKMGF